MSGCPLCGRTLPPSRDVPEWVMMLVVGLIALSLVFFCIEWHFLAVVPWLILGGMGVQSLRSTPGCAHCAATAAEDDGTFEPVAALALDHSPKGAFKRLTLLLSAGNRTTVNAEPGELEAIQLGGARRPRIALLEAGGARFSLALLRPRLIAPDELAARRAAIEPSLLEPFLAFEVRDDRLHATISARTLSNIDIEFFSRLAQAANGLDLGSLDQAFEQRPIEIHVLQARRIVFREGGLPRCPYCFESYATTQTDLVACESCQTVLHEGCWGELRRCPVLGCAGTSPERARVS